jgi:drug/metabolite transporter (DMT)-like permease
MNSKARHHDIITYLIFIFLVITWGAAYCFMKKALVVYSPLHTAFLRIIIAAMAMLPFAIAHVKKVDKNKLPIIMISGVLGNGLPALLYMYAMTNTDSNVAGILNGLTPIWILVIGYLFYKTPLSAIKICSVVLGFIAICVLFLSKGNIQQFSIPHTSLILLATLCYGINVNLISHHLKDVPSFYIGSLSLLGIGFIYLIIMLIGVQGQSLFTLSFMTKEMGYIAFLGIVTTAFCNILFFNLIKRSSSTFASMVTYIMPIVSIIIGYSTGEQIVWQSLVCFGLILISVYLAKFAK